MIQESIYDVQRLTDTSTVSIDLIQGDVILFQLQRGQLEIKLLDRAIVILTIIEFLFAVGKTCRQFCKSNMWRASQRSSRSIRGRTKNYNVTKKSQTG